MGTRADFYVGRGENAEWLGSIGYDGYPDGINTDILNAKTEEEFRTAVEDFFAETDHATRPEQGWPWPWEDSHLTDYSYAFDGGMVYGSSFGRPWFDASKLEPTFYKSQEAFDEDMQRSGFDEEDIEKRRTHALIGPDYGRDIKCVLCGHEMHPSVIYPSMKDRKNLALDKRSGLIFISL